MNELDQPLGLDMSARDGAHGRAAVVVFGLAGLAILAGSVGWFVLRSAPAAGTAAIEMAPPALATVPPDAPMLRSELRAEPATAAAPANARTITIIDGKTGKREVIVVGSDDDDGLTTGSVPKP